MDVKTGRRPDLRCVFDISDTGRKSGSYNLYIWKYKEEKHQDIVVKALEGRCGVSGKEGLLLQIAHIASQTAKEYWSNYRKEIRYGAEGSFLEELDDQNLRIRFCDMAAYSITYTVLLVRGQKAVQVRGIGNCSMTPEVQAFIY